MNSDIQYVLVGAIIGGGFVLIGAFLQYFLSLREDKIKRERDSNDLFVHRQRKNLVKGVNLKSITYCSRCGAEVPTGSSFCGSCGHPVSVADLVDKINE